MPGEWGETYCELLPAQRASDRGNGEKTREIAGNSQEAMSTRVEPLNHDEISPRNGIAPAADKGGVLEEKLFTKLLCLERKRAERSRKQFILALIDVQPAAPSGKTETALRERTLRDMTALLAAATRETDILGWYEQHRVLGVIFTELNGSEPADLVSRLSEKINATLRSRLPAAVMERVRISFHVFPEDWEEGGPGRLPDATLYPDLAEAAESRKGARLLKRAIDIAGSATALLLLSPLFVLISILIKLTSKGPVLFRQERIGQFGKPFQILKFRSMYNRSDPRIHMEYVNALIAGKKGLDVENGKGLKIYKLKDDPRITPLGKLLRRTSLDEIPQFWNVLKGEMSLVGPRPPVLYEVLSYDIWHRRRILEAKPGITGLWQVSGRSSTTFDDMVRLDLQYVKTWSVALDLKILLRTPGAVLSGDGAY